jgi:hypothetical protein
MRTREARRHVPTPRTVDDLFDGQGKLRPVYDREDVYAWFQRRHRRATRLIDGKGYYHSDEHKWKVPYGVRIAMTERLLWTQMVNKYPFFVTWVSPRTGKRLRKNFMSIPAAIIFITEQAQYVDPDASVVSKHGFLIPRKLMGKFPRRMGPAERLHYWCPRCMQPRMFKKNGEVFHHMKKFMVWNDKLNDEAPEWKVVKLSVIECQVCGISNRDSKFRASNQPVEKRRFKRGVTRARRKRAKSRR